MSDGGDEEYSGEHGRRSSDRELMEWRGLITERIKQHGTRLGELNGDLRDLRASVDAQTREVIGLRGEVKEAREDIGDVAASMRETRHDELVDLKATISAGRLTRMQVWIFVVAVPVISAIGVLIVTLVTQSGSHP